MLSQTIRVCAHWAFDKMIQKERKNMVVASDPAISLRHTEWGIDLTCINPPKWKLAPMQTFLCTELRIRMQINLRSCLFWQRYSGRFDKILLGTRKSHWQKFDEHFALGISSVSRETRGHVYSRGPTWKRLWWWEQSNQYIFKIVYRS